MPHNTKGLTCLLQVTSLRGGGGLIPDTTLQVYMYHHHSPQCGHKSHRLPCKVRLVGLLYNVFVPPPPPSQSPVWTQVPHVAVYSTFVGFICTVPPPQSPVRTQVPRVAVHSTNGVGGFSVIYREYETILLEHIYRYV